MSILTPSKYLQVCLEYAKNVIIYLRGQNYFQVSFFDHLWRHVGKSIFSVIICEQSNKCFPVVSSMFNLVRIENLRIGSEEGLKRGHMLQLKAIDMQRGRNRTFLVHSY